MKKKSFSVLLISVVSFLIISFLGMACTDELNAAGVGDSENDYPVIVEQLAERLDLDLEEVMEAFKDIGEERRERLEKSFMEKLDEAVEKGDITEEQKEAITAKQEEISEELQKIKELPLSEKREAVRDIADDLKEWAEENDIDFKDLFPLAHIRAVRLKRSGIKRYFSRVFRR